MRTIPTARMASQQPVHLSACPTSTGQRHGDHVAPITDLSPSPSTAKGVRLASSDRVFCAKVAAAMGGTTLWICPWRAR